MGRGWNIFFGILGILTALVGLIFAFLVGLTALGYELLSFILLLVFGLFAIYSSIYCFKNKKWAKFGVLASLVVVILVLYNLFSIIFDILFLF